MESLYCIDTRGKSFEQVKKDLEARGLAKAATPKYRYKPTGEEFSYLHVHKPFEAILWNDKKVLVETRDDFLCFPEGWSRWLSREEAMLAMAMNPERYELVGGDFP